MIQTLSKLMQPDNTVKHLIFSHQRNPISSAGTVDSKIILEKNATSVLLKNTLLNKPNGNNSQKGKAEVVKPNHGVVSHGIAIDELDLTDPKTIKLLEIANNLQSGVITNITPLRRKNKAHSENAKHYSIVIYTNDRHVANKLITNGIYINYLLHPAECFTPQFEKTQCFNCCDYGHRAGQCKRNSRCGKCGEKHNTRECKNTVVKCALCKGDHEAWHHECPASLAESNRLEEMKDNASHLFQSLSFIFF